MNNTLFSTIDKLDNAAKIPALRAVVHSSMAKAIGALRQHLRNQERAQRDEEIHGGLDARNSADEDARGALELANAAEFDVPVSPMQLASCYHSLFEEADAQLRTLVSSPYELPLDLDGMLNFMCSKAQPLDMATIKALQAVVKCSEADLRKLHEMQSLQEQEQMKALVPEIRALFEGMSMSPTAAAFANGYDDEYDGWDTLPVLARHQMGVKVYETLGKAKDQVLVRVMRTRRLTDLGNISLIDEGMAAIRKWVEDFERSNVDEIRNAFEEGKVVNTLPAVRTE